MPEPLVFWDIDGTILSTSMERLFIHHLLNHGNMSKWQLPLKYASLILSSRCKLHRLKLAYMRGMTESKVDILMDDCFEHDITPQLIPACTSAIERIKHARIKQVLLSGTILGLAERLGKYLGIDHIIAAIPETIDGRYTGRLTKPHPYSTQKTTEAKDWLTQNNIRWSQTVAFADNIEDKYLLQKAKLPIVINPRHTMSEYAKQSGWTIIDEPSGNMTADTIVDLVSKFQDELT